MTCAPGTTVRHVDTGEEYRVILVQDPGNEDASIVRKVTTGQLLSLPRFILTNKPTQDDIVLEWCDVLRKMTTNTCDDPINFIACYHAVITAAIEEVRRVYP